MGQQRREQNGCQQQNHQPSPWSRPHRLLQHRRWALRIDPGPGRRRVLPGGPHRQGQPTGEGGQEVGEEGGEAPRRGGLRQVARGAGQVGRGRGCLGRGASACPWRLWDGPGGRDRQQVPSLRYHGQPEARGVPRIVPLPSH